MTSIHNSAIRYDLFWNFIWKYNLIIFGLTRKLSIWEVLHSLSRMFRWCLGFIINIQKCLAVQLPSCKPWVRKCSGYCLPSLNVETVHPGLLERYYLMFPVRKKILYNSMNFISELFPYMHSEDLCFSMLLKKTLSLLLRIVKSLWQVGKFQKAICCLSK